MAAPSGHGFTSVVNIGPVLAVELHAAGIDSLAALREVGSTTALGKSRNS